MCERAYQWRWKNHQSMNRRDRKHKTEQVNGKQHESQYYRGQRKSPKGREEIRNKKVEHLHSYSSASFHIHGYALSQVILVPTFSMYALPFIILSMA